MSAKTGMNWRMKKRRQRAKGKGGVTRRGCSPATKSRWWHPEGLLLHVGAKVLHKEILLRQGDGARYEPDADRGGPVHNHSSFGSAWWSAAIPVMVVTSNAGTFNNRHNHAACSITGSDLESGGISRARVAPSTIA